MFRFRFADAVRLFSALIAGGMLACAQAAELGEPIVHSHMGQPLIADVEITALASPAIPVLVRVASADVYKGANIAMHPVLASVNMSVMRRDGRQFLHITSIKPVDSENIHLFLDLTEGSRRHVRAVTLWLTPDPTPAPKAQVALPSPVRVAEPAPAPVAYKVLAPPPEPAPQVDRPRAVRVISVPTSGAACPQAQFSQEQIKTCAAIDYKNGLLSAQIVELEDKVKRLQLAIEGAVPAPAAALTKAAQPPPAKPVPKPVPKPAGGFPWLLVIGVVLGLAIVGGAIWFVLSRRKGKTVETAAADSVGWYARLAGPFRRKVKVVNVVVEEAKDA